MQCSAPCWWSSHSYGFGAREPEYPTTTRPTPPTREQRLCSDSGRANDGHADPKRCHREEQNYDRRDADLGVTTTSPTTEHNERRDEESHAQHHQADPETHRSASFCRKASSQIRACETSHSSALDTPASPVWTRTVRCSPAASTLPRMPAGRITKGLRYGLLLTAVAVSLSACTTQAAAPPALADSSPALTEAPSAVSTSVPSAFAHAATAAPLISPEQSHGLTSSPWKLIAISRNGRTLTLQASQGGGCDKPGGIELTQTKTSVEVTSLYEQGSPPPGTACAAYLATPVWSIQLEDPLGNRALIHAPASGSVP